MPLCDKRDPLHETELPEAIRQHIGGKPCQTDAVGLSGAQTFLFDHCVLKIDAWRRKNDVTVDMMRWLEGKRPVPKVICYAQDEARQYLLMSRIPGRMSCDEYYLARPRELVARLAEALQMLWQVDITDCPRVRDLNAELAEARYRVENGLVDVDRAEPTAFGPGGFRDPTDLLCWLEDHRPDYEPALSHGDLCLPNIFIDGDRVSGFVDLGDCGIGDKWRDVAMCHRSLRWNAEGVFGGRTYPDTDPDMLFDALGLAPNMEKIRYYTLLDELF